MWPDSGTVHVADVAALADRWQQRWPSARHASPAASLTVANMRHLLLDALWKQLPTATPAQQRERAVRLQHLADWTLQRSEHSASAGHPADFASCLRLCGLAWAFGEAPRLSWPAG